jgi:hypothetical protein
MAFCSSFSVVNGSLSTLSDGESPRTYIRVWNYNGIWELNISTGRYFIIWGQQSSNN